MLVLTLRRTARYCPKARERNREGPCANRQGLIRNTAVSFFFFFPKHVTAAAMAFLLQQIMLCVICFLVSKHARAILLCNSGVLLPAAFFVEVSFLISARWWGTKGHLSSITAFTVPAMHWRLSYCGLTRFVHGCDQKSTKSKRLPVCLWGEAEKQMGAGELSMVAEKASIFLDAASFFNCSLNWSGLFFLTSRSYFAFTVIPFC